jgi:hypothetical protein
VYVVELASGVRPTGGQHDVAARGEPLEARIAVDLEDPAESFEVRGWMLRFAIWTVEVNRRRWIRTDPRSIISRIDPESACLGATATRIEHRDRRVVGEDLVRREHMGGAARLQRL